MKHFERNNRSAFTSKALVMVAGGILTLGLLNPVSAQQGGGGQQGGFQGGQGGGQQGGQGGRQGGRGGNRGQMREQMLKAQLERAGYTDAAFQTTIVDFVKSKETGRQTLYDAANALSEGLADETATDATVGKLYDTFDTALAAERLRVKKLELQLDTQIKYSGDKRLTAVLTLAGVIGDALSYLSQGGQGGPGGGMGGQGGPGGMGGQGGGMGGQGGQGGGGQQGGFQGGGGGFNGGGGGQRQGGPGGPPPQDF